MAAIDFPNSPAVDQLFQASNNAIYKWNGTIWVAVGNTAALYVGDTPPVNPWKSQLWFNSAQARLYIYYDDGNTTQWVPSAPIPATSNPPTPPPAPGADPGCRTLYLASNTTLAVPAGWTNLLTTVPTGLAGQTWRISGYIGINNNPAQWSAAEIIVSSGAVVGGAVTLSNTAIYNSVNGATANGYMDATEVLTGPCTFTLRGQGAATAVASGGRATGLTTQRLA